MADEVQLISDDDGVAVIGSPTGVERFLHSLGLLSLSKELGMDRHGWLLRAAAGVAEAVSENAAASGRWVKLTQESAEAIKKFGLTDTDTPGIKWAMAGERGSMKSWLQIDGRPSALVSNPALLSGAAGVMAQVARQQEMSEITDALAKIDQKLDDVRRHQRDEVLAGLDGVAEAVKEAVTIQAHVGRVSDVAWSKVQSTSMTIAQIQSSALRELNALAARLESQTKAGDLARSALAAKVEVGVWLATLARCFQVQDEIAILELDRVRQEAPSELDGHRMALRVARDDRREVVLQATQGLLSRIEGAVGAANAQALLHLPKARAVVTAVNHIGTVIDAFHAPFGVGSSSNLQTATRWRDAARERQQWKGAAGETVPKVIVGAVGVVGSIVVAGVVAQLKDGDRRDG